MNAHRSRLPGGCTPADPAVHRARGRLCLKAAVGARLLAPLLLATAAFQPPRAVAAEVPEAPATTATLSANLVSEELAPPWTVRTFQAVRPSVVTVKQLGDHGEVLGVGTGFAVEGGLIATCFHVIGEGRGLMVELDGGGETPVAEIAAWDEVHDLALLRPLGVSLPPLPLADQEPEPGAPVLAVGNPMGLNGSVTAGVVSSHRDIGGQRLIQVAIPIELGNSGGPLLDPEGRVLGLLTYKSAITDNLGFAVPIERLRDLRRHPNPMSMARWQGVDALDDDCWEVAFDGNWRSRGGAIAVTCQGERHTGRTICWRREKVGPKDDAWSVWLRFDPGTGGAGIALAGDDEHLHDGLFVSEGKLLLVRFSGAGSGDWKSLASVPASGWRRNAWNQLILQRSGRRYRGRLNGQPLISVEADEALPTQRVGLLKLGRSHADFRGLLATGAALSEVDPQPALALARRAIEPENRSLAEKYRGTPIRPQEVESAARLLEQAAERLRDTNRRLSQRRKAEEFQQLVTQPAFDAARAALIAATLADAEAPEELAWMEWSRAAERFARGRTQNESGSEKLNALRAFFFEELGWRVPAEDRVEPNDHSLIAAWDRRRVSPGLLRLLCLSLADRAGLPLQALTEGHDLEWRATNDAPQRLDIATLSLHPLSPEQRLGSSPAHRRDLVIELLRGLIGPEDSPASPKCAQALDALIAIAPRPVPERFTRGWMRLRAGDRAGWQEDWEWARTVAPEYFTSERIAACLETLRVNPPAWKMGLPDTRPGD